MGATDFGATCVFFLDVFFGVETEKKTDGRHQIAYQKLHRKPARFKYPLVLVFLCIVALQAYLAISNMEQATGIPQTFPDWHNQEASKKYDDLFATFVPLAKSIGILHVFVFEYSWDFVFETWDFWNKRNTHTYSGLGLYQDTHLCHIWIHPISFWIFIQVFFFKDIDFISDVSKRSSCYL